MGFEEGERNYGENGIYSQEDIIEQYGIHPSECKFLPDGQLVRYLEVWMWSDGSLHTSAEPDHIHLECVKARRHYIESDNVCRNYKSSKL